MPPFRIRFSTRVTVVTMGARGSGETAGACCGGAGTQAYERRTGLYHERNRRFHDGMAGDGRPSATFFGLFHDDRKQAGKQSSSNTECTEKKIKPTLDREVSK